jgi:predicted RNA-binding Zn-ribbon protein involved in translation (DUF1610 family)
MKTLFLMLVASLFITASFAQKAKAFNLKPNAPTVIAVGGSSSSLSLKEQMKAEVTKLNSYSTNVSFVKVLPSCPKCREQLVVNRTGSKQLNKVYTCEMHPQMACNKDRRCPVCKA